MQKEDGVIPVDEIHEALDDNKRLMKILGISDAGLAFFWGYTNPRQLELGGNSGSFHAVSDEADRIRSAQIAKRILGSENGIGLIASGKIKSGRNLSATHIKDMRFQDGLIHTPLEGFLDYSSTPNCAYRRQMIHSA